MGRFLKLAEGMTIYEFNGNFNAVIYMEDLLKYAQDNPLLLGSKEFDKLLLPTQEAHPAPTSPIHFWEAPENKNDRRGAMVVGDKVKPIDWAKLEFINKISALCCASGFSCFVASYAAYLPERQWHLNISGYIFLTAGLVTLGYGSLKMKRKI